MQYLQCGAYNAVPSNRTGINCLQIGLQELVVGARRKEGRRKERESENGKLMGNFLGEFGKFNLQARKVDFF